jgi:hypothetical protein
MPTVFELSRPATLGGAWTLATIHIFHAHGDGTNPTGSLPLGRRGEIYGVTNVGGGGPCPYGCGAVFRLLPPAAPDGFGAR